MIRFLINQWKVWQISKKMIILHDKARVMTEDMSKLKGKDFKEKYNGNPQREWALLQWERIKLNREKKRLGL